MLLTSIAWRAERSDEEGEEECSPWALDCTSQVTMESLCP